MGWTAMGRNGMFWDIVVGGSVNGLPASFLHAGKNPGPLFTKTTHLVTKIFFSLPGSKFSMAPELTGFIIFLIICVLFIAFIMYAYLNSHLAKNKRRDLIRAFRASPKIIKDGPILVQGQAQAPDLILPTTGEHVAFHSLFVVSRESAIADTRIRSSVQIGGFSQSRTSITRTKGFRFFETSGDFTVVSGGTPYLVSVTGMLAQFAKGASMFTSFVAGEAKNAGLTEGLWNETMNFHLAEEALRMLCGFSAPIGTERSTMRSGFEKIDYATSSIVTVTSRIDSRIHYLVAGQNLPPGIQDLLAKRGIVPEEKDEIIVVETFIPLNREVYVFGTFDGDKSIVSKNGTVRLSVSYTDPEEE
jgi:hypothetical protein